jgi:cellulose synthase/poly-beta-1,6-N-acetylglucosamine synthase-like glycosyltransferase
MFTVWPYLIFWTSAICLAITYVLYPLVCRWFARTFPRPPIRRDDASVPSITVIIVAHNEATRLPERIANLLSSDYPPEKLHILIMDDGSTDTTRTVLDSLKNPQVRYIHLAERKGKPAALNAGISASAGEICIFGDARQTFASDTIRRLAAAFSDTKVGAVSGELEIAAGSSTIGIGIGSYWEHERRLRSDEAAHDSCIGCTGACYAIRRILFSPLPEDTLLDDVVIPLRIAAEGYRILHDRAALAYDEQPQDPKFEGRRKRRTLAGNFQMLFRYLNWLLPTGHRLWWQIIAHKYLRILAPLMLLGTLTGALALWPSPFFSAAFCLQVLCYLLAIVGLISRSRAKIFSWPASFLFLNLMVVLAFFDYLTGRASQKWAMQKNAGPQPSVDNSVLDSTKR